MLEIHKVCIGIQARSTSQRFPGKVHEPIEGRSVLDNVLDTCFRSAGYINNSSQRAMAHVKVSLLVPQGDEIAELYSHRVPVIQGDESDVLSRYQTLATTQNADFIVRITADCPRIPEYVISKHIVVAIKNRYDYLSNVHEGMRTAPDGFDCEVISRKAMEWLSDNAKEPQDREHVTTLLRRAPPSWLSKGLIVGYIDLHDLKLSVDTPADLERVAQDARSVDEILKKAREFYGKSAVHRL